MIGLSNSQLTMDRKSDKWLTSWLFLISSESISLLYSHLFNVNTYINQINAEFTKREKSGAR
jgi:hypothetical protein